MHAGQNTFVILFVSMQHMKIVMYKRVRVRTEKSDGLKEYIDFLRNIAILL